MEKPMPLKWAIEVEKSTAREESMSVFHWDGKRHP